MKMKNALQEFVASIVAEVLQEQLAANPKSAPPPVSPQIAATSRLQAVANGTNAGPININNVLKKRELGQPLTPQEKRAYLDHVAGQNVAAKQQAQAQAGQGQTMQAIQAIEKNPERFVKQ